MNSKSKNKLPTEIMKKYINAFAILVITFLSSAVLAQNATSNNQALNRILEADQSRLGNMSVSNNSNKGIKGSIHLFEEWNNNGEIHTSKGQKFSVNNININLQKNTFESKVHNDSILTFDLAQVTKVVLNGKTFKSLSSNYDQKIYEVIYEKGDVALLRSSTVKLIESSVNPMLSRTEDKFIQKHAYYLKEQEKIKRVNPNKKLINSLVGDDTNQAEVIQNYIRKYNSNLKKSNLSSRVSIKKKFLDETRSIGISVFEAPSRVGTQPRLTVEGTKYLFDDWNNRAFIYTEKGEKMMVNKVNLNMQQKMFESKFINDIIFTFSFRNLERIVVKNRTFKRYYGENDTGGVYELIYESDQFSVLKKFSIKYISASPNPMAVQKERYVRQFHYFYLKNNEIKPLRLKKKQIFNLIDLTDEDMPKMNAFVKANKLSFKKENDLKRILEFNATSK